MKIEDIQLKIIPDSRGKDTLEATLRSGDFEASASVPSGKSTGATEVAVLPPDQAITKIPWLLSQLKDQQFVSLEQFDFHLLTLDGTPNKSSLGGNLILALSMAFARLLAKEANLELFEFLARTSGTKQSLPLRGKKIKMPFCFFNLINGGLHAENSLPFQEYLLIPQTKSPKQNLEIALSATNVLKEKIQSEYGQVNYGDEGGFTVPSNDPLKGLQLLQNLEGKFGLDVAASTMTEKQSIEFYKKVVEKFPILSIEDPYPEEDWDDFSKITAELGNKIWIIGDDLLTTNVARIKKAYALKAVNAVLIKPNQIGTITETIQAVNLAKSYGWKIVVSHRSGETMDTFIADLAVGVGADGLKSGCPLQKERLVKYQRLVEIEGTWRN
ncbi:hypothetical protein HYU94_02580 [Candidatus Daviesbacteria bacterium]|nr:hypothetical protein [Candidatus Daviesbacteria bacterium]